MNGGTLVLAYHGCDISVRDRLVRGMLPGLRKSSNRYDWLGPGVYFFENDAARARHFAEAAAANPDKRFTNQPIATPAVVGAVLRVSVWLDMTTQEGMANWLAAFNTLKAEREGAGRPMPENTKVDDADETVLLRQLDNAVFTTLPAVRAQNKLPALHAIRGAFYQGKPLAGSSSEFLEHTHVQIALLEEDCVQGWFLPSGDQLLTDEELLEAQAALEDKIATNKKPRVRAAAG